MGPSTFDFVRPNTCNYPCTTRLAERKKENERESSKRITCRYDRSIRSEFPNFEARFMEQMGNLSQRQDRIKENGNFFDHASDPLLDIYLPIFYSLKRLQSTEEALRVQSISSASYLSYPFKRREGRSYEKIVLKNTYLVQ